mmetsp:Transcript_33326/g.61098  ORF Transcript_33326/g.61098 Transcript_33326/m.61098 type:complete len:388 (-) Transcript_33326:58-1221(-)
MEALGLDGEDGPSAEAIQAQLMIRAMLLPLREGSSQSVSEDTSEEIPGPSPFLRAVRDEIDAVLSESLNRRLKALEKKKPPVANGSRMLAKAAEPQGVKVLRPTAVQEVQTEGLSLQTQLRLQDAVASAVTHASRVSLKPVKAFGPSKIQHKATEPPEKREAMVKECETLRDTLSTLGRSVSSRIKQIESLKQQLALCTQQCGEREEEAKKAADMLSRLKTDRSSHADVRQQRLKKRRQRVLELRANLKEAQEQEVRYKGLAQHQRAFFVQSERISLAGGLEVVAHSPCGEIFLPPPPPEIGDQEPSLMWDIGTQIANPYVVDSWPFEPNCLARRTAHESAEAPILEAEEEDEEDEDDDEDEEDEYADDAEVEDSDEIDEEIEDDTE